MLKNLRKEFNKLIGKEEVTMSIVEQAPQAVVEAPVEAPAANLEATNAVAEQLSAALASLEEVKSQLSAVVAEKDALLAKIGEDKNKARMSVITKAVGEAKAPALFTATQGMADADFQAVVSALAGSVEEEAQSPLFKEVGAEAEADEDTVLEVGAGVNKILNQKYNQSK